MGRSRRYLAGLALTAAANIYGVGGGRAQSQAGYYGPLCGLAGAFAASAANGGRVQAPLRPQAWARHHDSLRGLGRAPDRTSTRL